MTKPNAEIPKVPDPNDPGAAAPPQASVEISTDCVMCSKNVLDGVGGFLRVGFQRFVLREGSVAELLETPEGQSDLVLICTACSMMPAWVIAKRAIQAHEQAAEEAARQA